MKELLDIISCEFSKLKRLKFILISILGACLFPIPATILIAKDNLPFEQSCNSASAKRKTGSGKIGCVAVYIIVLLCCRVRSYYHWRFHCWNSRGGCCKIRNEHCFWNYVFCYCTSCCGTHCIFQSQLYFFYYTFFCICYFQF